MRIQDFRFFIPPNFPLKEKHPSRISRLTTMEEIRSGMMKQSFVY